MIVLMGKIRYDLDQINLRFETNIYEKNTFFTDFYFTFFNEIRSDCI